MELLGWSGLNEYPFIKVGRTLDEKGQVRRVSLTLARADGSSPFGREYFEQDRAVQGTDTVDALILKARKINDDFNAGRISWSKATKAF